MINLSVSIFGQITGYGIYTLSREPIRLLEIQYPVIWAFNKTNYLRFLMVLSHSLED